MNCSGSCEKAKRNLGLYFFFIRVIVVRNPGPHHKEPVFVVSNKI